MPIANPPSTAGPVQQRVIHAIATASRRTGMDFDYLMGQAKLESALDPTAKARTSTASGLFQFTRQTWLSTLKAHGAEHDLGWAANAISQDARGRYRVDDPALHATIADLRHQPEAASAMAAALASDNADYLATRTGRAAEPVDLYLAHFLGAAGAARFLTAMAADPDAPAAPLLPEAAAANRTIFYATDGTPRSLTDIRTRFADKLNDAAGQPKPDMPSGYWAAASLPSPPLPIPQADSPAIETKRPPLLHRIEPMPRHLSLDFARQAYQRLAAMDGGAAT